MKKFLSLLLVLAICLSLSACSTNQTVRDDDDEDVDYTLEGTYAYAHTYEGDDIISLITLKPDSTYLRTVVKNGSVTSNRSEDYELVDGEVKLYDPGTNHGVATVYTFEGGNLTGSDTLYKRVSEGDAVDNRKGSSYILDGTYAYAHTHEGVDIIILITLDSGTYLKTVVKDGIVTSNEFGDYELDGEKLKLYDYGTNHGSATVYTFKGGNLTGADTVYKKISEDN